MIEPPAASWIPFLKIGCGVLLITLLAVLACIIGLGKVEQSTSFGLQDILGGLLVMSGMFGSWCYSSKDKD